MTDEKVRENRIRRMAARQQLMVSRNRRRDPRAWDYGLYSLVDASGNTLVLGNATLDEVEHWLTTDDLATPSGNMREAPR